MAAYAIYYLATTEGTLAEKLRKGIKPAIKMRPDAVSAKKPEGGSANGGANASAELNVSNLPKEVELDLIKNIDNSNHA